MELQLSIDEMINAISALIPIPENAGPVVLKQRLELIIKLYEWQSEYQIFLKTPGLKNEKQNKQGSNTQINTLINNQGNNIINK